MKKLYVFRQKRGSRVLRIEGEANTNAWANQMIRNGDTYESFEADHESPRFCNQVEKIDERTVSDDYVPNGPKVAEGKNEVVFERSDIKSPGTETSTSTEEVPNSQTAEVRVKTAGNNPEEIDEDEEDEDEDKPKAKSAAVVTVSKPHPKPTAPKKPAALPKLGKTKNSK